MPNSRTPDEVLDEAVARVVAGESTMAVCKDLGISRTTLRDRRRDQLPANLATRGKTMGGRTRAAQIPRGTGYREPIYPGRWDD